MLFSCHRCCFISSYSVDASIVARLHRLSAIWNERALRGAKSGMDCPLQPQESGGQLVRGETTTTPWEFWEEDRHWLTGRLSCAQEAEEPGFDGEVKDRWRSS